MIDFEDADELSKMFEFDTTIEEKIKSHNWYHQKYGLLFEFKIVVIQ